MGLSSAVAFQSPMSMVLSFFFCGREKPILLRHAERRSPLARRRCCAAEDAESGPQEMPYQSVVKDGPGKSARHAPGRIKASVRRCVLHHPAPRTYSFKGIL